MDDLELKWGEQYPIVIKSWRDNWILLSAYFEFTEGIRRMIYTTNTVEGYHRQLRKVTKNKGVFPSDTALKNSFIWPTVISARNGVCHCLIEERRLSNLPLSLETDSKYYNFTLVGTGAPAPCR
ncbi:hypothetical protein GGR07_001163 [Bacteroides pyogenes]|nr:hypothetical protein [Bacteroides pyogenes]